MEKTKRVIIALTIALVFLLICNFVTTKYTSNRYVEVAVAGKDLKRGETIFSNLSWLKVSETEYIQDLFKTTITKGDVTDQSVIATSIKRGQPIFKEDIQNKDELTGTNIKDLKQQIAIPLDGSSYSAGYMIKKNDIVDVYYTTKTKQVNLVLKDKQKIYSSNDVESMVTCRLLEKVQILETYGTGNGQSKQNIITDIILEVSEKDAMLIANLKEQGVFDVVLLD